MGSIREAPLADLALALRGEHEIHTFVETGTFTGDTAAWAAQHFPHVITVEASPHYFQQAAGRHGSLPTVDFRFGHSGQVMRDLIPDLHGPVLFWLDAHWSTGNTYGAGDECPLLEELSAIMRRDEPNIILIDDARYITAPPPPPHDPGQWPGLTDIVGLLNQAAEPYYVAIFHDVIVALPRAHASAFTSFMRTQDTESAGSQLPARTIALLRRVRRRLAPAETHTCR